MSTYFLLDKEDLVLNKPEELVCIYAPTNQTTNHNMSFLYQQRII